MEESPTRWSCPACPRCSWHHQIPAVINVFLSQWYAAIFYTYPHQHTIFNGIYVDFKNDSIIRNLIESQLEQLEVLQEGGAIVPVAQKRAKAESVRNPLLSAQLGRESIQSELSALALLRLEPPRK